MTPTVAEPVETAAGSTRAAGLRVAQVIGRLGGGGAQRAAWNLAVALAGRGADSHALGLREGGAFTREGSSGVRAEVLGVEPGRLLSAATGLWRLRRWIRRRGIRVLHVHGTDCLVFSAFATFGLRRRPRLFFTWHDSEKVLSQSGIRRRALRWALGRCEALSGSSADVARRLRENLGGGRTVEVWRNAVPAPPLPDRRDREKPRILWIGRFGPVKDPVLLVRAATELRDRGLPFQVEILGDATEKMAWYREDLRRRIDEAGLTDHVALAGWVEDPGAHLARADIAVQSSRSEGLSLALLEQMMAGLAIVATDVGDTRDALADGACGILVPPGDAKALAEALRRLITDPLHRARLGAAARARAIDRYGLGQAADTALDRYLAGERR